MKIPTTRFGEIDVPEGEVYTFPEGLLGFSEARSFVLLENPAGGPFRWLQSGESSSLAFVVLDPLLFFPDYRVGIRAEDLAALGLDDPSHGVVVVILTVPRELKQTTANLQGPVVLNPAGRRGRQLVLSDPAYTTRHRLFPEAGKGA